MFVLLVPKITLIIPQSHQAVFNFSKFGVFNLLVVPGKLMFQANNSKVCNRRAANSQDSWQECNEIVEIGMHKGAKVYKCDGESKNPHITMLDRDVHLRRLFWRKVKDFK